MDDNQLKAQQLMTEAMLLQDEIEELHDSLAQKEEVVKREVPLHGLANGCEWIDWWNDYDVETLQTHKGNESHSRFVGLLRFFNFTQIPYLNAPEEKDVTLMVRQYTSSGDRFLRHVQILGCHYRQRSIDALAKGSAVPGNVFIEGREYE